MGLFAEIKKTSTIANITCFLLAFCVATYLVIWPPYPVERGFLCGDVNIRYPLRRETISTSMLVAISLFPVFSLVIILELTYGVFYRCKFDDSHGHGSQNESTKDGLMCGLAKAGLMLVCLIHGNCLCFIVTEIFKVSFGSLRPSFLSACQPAVDFTQFENCSTVYIEHVECTSTDSSLLIDIRKSFVSGHASMVTFNMFFAMLYLHLHLPMNTPHLLLPLYQSVAFGICVYISSTRITDHMHHFQDVLGGFLLGIVMATSTMYKMCPSFARHPPNHISRDAASSTLPTLNKQTWM